MPTGKNAYRGKCPQGKMSTRKNAHREKLPQGKMPTMKNAHTIQGKMMQRDYLIVLGGKDLLLKLKGDTIYGDGTFDKVPQMFY